MKKYKIGYTQGTFDMFHIGHLNLLHQASALCDTLIVGVNSDQLVNEYKHKTPVVSERDRAAIVGELRCVDKVVLCDTLSKTEAWQRLHFDAIFIGSDWKGNERWQQTERYPEESAIDHFLSGDGELHPCRLQQKSASEVCG
jgi:glycerol-3-phosphate cytidylyltransferase